MASQTRVPGSRPEHFTRDPELLVPDITEAEIARLRVHEGKVVDGYLTHEKWIVDNCYVKPQYGSPAVVTVWSPCCGQKRQRIQHGYAFSCPSCGWWWRYHCLGWTTRMVSVGKERPT